MSRMPTQTVATSTTKTKKGAPARKAPVTSKAVSVMSAFLVNDMSFGHDTWFAATSGGVLESKDFGATWKSAGKDSMLHKPAQSVEVSSDGNQVWALSERNLVYSADKGATWEGKELSFASAGNLKIHRLDDATLFITTNMGLYASRDAGRNWNRQEVRDLSFQSVAGSGNALVVSLQHRGLIASFDGGKTWQHMDDQLSQGYFPVDGHGPGWFGGGGIRDRRHPQHGAKCQVREHQQRIGHEIDLDDSKRFTIGARISPGAFFIDGLGDQKGYGKNYSQGHSDRSEEFAFGQIQLKKQIPRAQIALGMTGLGRASQPARWLPPIW